METLDTIHCWLEQTGWQNQYGSKTHDLWWRRMCVKPECFANQGKGGVVVQLKEYVHGEHVSYTVEVAAEADDGVWIDFSCYGIGLSELRGCLERQIDKLARAWVACQTGQGGRDGCSRD
jgi:hypothetical protein